jgi:ribonuclease HI
MQEPPWLVYCDGAWGNIGAGAVAILTSPSEIKLYYATRLQFAGDTDKCTNNIAEYEIILLGLRKLRAIGVQTCVLHTDYKVVSGQIEKECIAREQTLERYLALVRRMGSYFKGFMVEYIECNKNAEADDLKKAAAHNTPMVVDVFFQVLEDASVKTVLPELRVINIIEGEDWRAPIMAYLCHYDKLDSKNDQIGMRQCAKEYQVVGNELYKTSILGPLLSCISSQEILQKVNVRICGGHIGAHALAAKVLQQGFYWPAMIDDTTKLVSTCEACQKFSHRCRAPAQPSLLVAPSWPLQRWSINIVGKLTLAHENYTFTIVPVEYFTKWIEAKPVTNITSTTIQNFF